MEYFQFALAILQYIEKSWDGFIQCFMIESSLRSAVAQWSGHALCDRLDSGLI